MSKESNIKEQVKSKYSEIALQSKESNESSCCGSGGCSGEVFNIMTDDYEGIVGYNKDADLGLGCGLPTEFAQIKAGDTVIDLGSGAGNDCFVARAATGPAGEVIGIDFTPAMIERARINAAKLGFTNVSFKMGDIEQMPVPDATADVIVSNCVLNLVPDKKAVFSEIFRVLKPGGHFSISDIVLNAQLPPAILRSAEMYAGCVAGAVQKRDYLQIIEVAGFEAISLQKEKPIIVPGDILSNFLSKEEIAIYNDNKNVIESITVFARKPQPASCCAPGCCN